MKSPDRTNVAVIGGGVAGFYAAWRLKKQNFDGKITIFEGSDRIGGRLMSVTPPGMPSVRCELGGMRYMSNQPYISSLIENKFKLATREFNVYDDENIAYLRGVHLRMKELNNAGNLPYNLSWSEKANVSDLMGYAVRQIAPDASKYKGNELINYLKNVKFNGKYLYEEGFWNLLYKVLSPEAFTYMTDSCGYDVVTQNWNALDMILVNTDFDPDAKYKIVNSGYETVVYELKDEFLAAGGEVFQEHSLKILDSTKENGLHHLTFLDGKGEIKEVWAEQVILALPRRSLELIEIKGVLSESNQKFRKAVRSVTPIPFFKVFVCYHEAWWENLGITKGRSVTDLPVRQCYYWGTEGAQEGANPNNTNSVLLASYDDSGDVNYWTGLIDETEEILLTSTHRFDDGENDTWRKHLAPRRLTEEINRQLAEIHGLQYVPAFYSAAYMDWSKDPYGGGINVWNIHEKSWELIPYMVNPTEGLERIFICGDAYSNKQGWVEGALETAEMMLQNYFNLPAPEWIY
jgi:monoamine oxidase